MVKMFKNAEKALKNNVKKPYVLDEAGIQIVYASNRDLSEAYFEHLEFPVSDFWFKYFSDKINILPPSNYSSGLDICAGTGTVCLNLMRKNFFKQCHAIDISDTAVKRLEHRIAKLGIKNLTASCENIMKTTFEDKQFDCIVGNSFLHHLPDNESFIIEMYRILRPGGTICFTGEPTKAAGVLELLIMGNLLVFLRFIGLKSKARPVPLSDIWLYDHSSLTKLLTDAGFSDIRIAPFGFLTPIFNEPSAFIYHKLTKKSMQPDGWWSFFTKLDKIFFSWLPKNCHSHFVISAIKL